jgi:hypothetical protein
LEKLLFLGLVAAATFSFFASDATPSLVFSFFSSQNWRILTASPAGPLRSCCEQLPAGHHGLQRTRGAGHQLLAVRRLGWRRLGRGAVPTTAAAAAAAHVHQLLVKRSSRIISRLIQWINKRNFSN